MLISSLDFCWWLGVLGEWDVPTLAPATAHVTIAVSGANGGHTVDFRELADVTTRPYRLQCEQYKLNFALADYIREREQET